MTVQRDRDEFGRARSSRARDALGRPLPLGAVGVPGIPEDLQLSPAETLVYAQELLDQGLAFNAHEVFESAWKNGPATDRTLWQGLAQLAVGITHIQRGNRKGAVALLQRAARRLGEIDDVARYGIDIVGLIRAADTLSSDLQSGADIAAPRLRPRLAIT